MQQQHSASEHKGILFFVRVASFALQQSHLLLCSGLAANAAALPLIASTTNNKGEASEARRARDRGFAKLMVARGFHESLK